MRIIDRKQNFSLKKVEKTSMRRYGWNFWSIIHWAVETTACGKPENVFWCTVRHRTFVIFVFACFCNVRAIAAYCSSSIMWLLPLRQSVSSLLWELRVYGAEITIWYITFPPGHSGGSWGRLSPMPLFSKRSEKKRKKSVSVPRDNKKDQTCDVTNR